MAMSLDANGLHVRLPDRWEGAVGVARGLDADAVTRRRAAVGRAPAMAPTAHLANFALPSERGDFGSGAVETMTANGAFVALVEYGPSEVGTALFPPTGLPRAVRPRDFHPRALQRTIRGQAGLQVFATEAGRAFCLYVVLGRRADLSTLVDEVNDVLGTIRVDPR
jgi:hypothetical protein